MLWLFPEARTLFSKEGVTFGELGLFVIIAYTSYKLLLAEEGAATFCDGLLVT
jgi:hypothetical protein